MAVLIIKEIARKKGINQSQLQLKAGVSAQLLNRYWNNRTRSVALDQLERIAKALDEEPGKLIISDAEAMRGGMKRWSDLNRQDTEEDVA